MTVLGIVGWNVDEDPGMELCQFDATAQLLPELMEST